MRRAWVGFWLLSVIWGSSYLLIRIGVQEIGQYQLVFMRSTIAAVGMITVVLLQGKRLPRTWNEIYPLIAIGIGNTAIPFLLITWGEKSVESGLGAVLQATTSLFGFIIAHFAFDDERLTWQKIAGITIGFAGIIMLASRSWVGGTVVESSLLGQLAIVLASLFYAVFTVYSKKVIRTHVDPVIVSAGAMTSCAITVGLLMIAAPLSGGQGWVPLTQVSENALLSVLILGFLNTWLAYLIYYSLIHRLGAARTNMTTFVTPVVGLMLGGVILNEQLDLRLAIGALMILSGIGLVNLKGVFERLRRSQTVEVGP